MVNKPISRLPVATYDPTSGFTLLKRSLAVERGTKAIRKKLYAQRCQCNSYLYDKGAKAPFPSCIQCFKL